jgi:hypothetical protein
MAGPGAPISAPLQGAIADRCAAGLDFQELLIKGAKS